jgi:hypothetical protein
MFSECVLDLTASSPHIQFDQNVELLDDLVSFAPIIA